MDAVLLIFVWILLSVALGALASSRGRSGIGFFFLSAFFSPILGLIVVLVLKDEKEAEAAERRRVEDQRLNLAAIKAISGKPDEADGSRAAPVSSIADELAKLAELKDKGVLTQEEFDVQKRRLLSQSHISKPAAPSLTEMDCDLSLMRLGYKLKRSGSEWVVTEPLGGRAKISNFNELVEYTQSKRIQARQPA